MHYAEHINIDQLNVFPHMKSRAYSLSYQSLVVSATFTVLQASRTSDDIISGVNALSDLSRTTRIRIICALDGRLIHCNASHWVSRDRLSSIDHHVFRRRQL